MKDKIYGILNKHKRWHNFSMLHNHTLYNVTCATNKREEKPMILQWMSTTTMSRQTFIYKC